MGIDSRISTKIIFFIIKSNIHKKTTAMRWFFL
jgi:hypothetical protein